MIYLDYNSSSLLHPYAKEKWHEILEFSGNSSSPHCIGVKARNIVNQAREDLAKILSCEFEKLIFTSGGTESIALALHIAMTQNDKKITSIFVGCTEHPAILKMSKDVATKFNINHHILKCEEDGTFDEKKLNNMFTKEKENVKNFFPLVILMSSNNETGVICEYDKIYHAIDFDFQLMSDSCQTFCKKECNIKKEKIDYFIASSHKIGAGFGCGILALSENISINKEEAAIFKGGSHEFNLRAGTMNFHAIYVFAKMVNFFKECDFCLCADVKNELLRLENYLHENYDAYIFGKNAKRMGHVASISMPFMDKQSLLIRLDLNEICVSAGSACSSGKNLPSACLMNMVHDEKIVNNAIRISVGHQTKKEDIDNFIDFFDKEFGEFKIINA